MQFKSSQKTYHTYNLGFSQVCINVEMHRRPLGVALSPNENFVIPDKQTFFDLYRIISQEHLGQITPKTIYKKKKKGQRAWKL